MRPDLLFCSDEGRASFAELEGKAPWIAQHDQLGAIGEVIIAEGGRTGFDQTRSIGIGVFAGKRDVQYERIHRGVVGHLIHGVAVDLNRSGLIVGEKMRFRGHVHDADDFETEMSDIPCGDGGGIRNVIGDVFDFHRVWKGTRGGLLN